MEETLRRRRRPIVTVVLLVPASLLCLAYALNASWLAPAPQGRPVVIAHRGVAQQFDRTGLGRQDCTATRIFDPVHPFLENTLASIREATRLGADIVEVDVAPTRDQRIVLFHDWTVDCRTDGRGETRAHSLAELKALDIGYGYTADGGRTFPFRGRGIGLMPTLEEALRAFPEQRLLINFKSRDPWEADAVAAAFRRAGVAIDEKYSFYGVKAPLDRMRRYAPNSWMFDLDRMKACSLGYLKWGWAGHVAEACRGGTIAVPVNYRRLAWGWPNRFLARMASAGTRVIISGEMIDGKAPPGLARPDQIDAIPPRFRGYLWVEDIYALRSHLPMRDRAGTP
jgi:glycerophosphoryl diester phosphodiesterase